MSIMKSSKGFTLIEMAVVLGILSALLAMMIIPLSGQRETANIRKMRADLEDIEEALYGYAMINGALPCPAMPGMGGAALASGAAGSVSTTDCDRSGTQQFHGFVPYQSLGLKGQVDCYGLLLDPWGQPYRYSVTSVDAGVPGIDFVRVDGIKAEAATGDLSVLRPDIRLCNDASVTCDASTLAQYLLANNIAAVVFSLGKHNQNLSTLEDYNAGEASEAVSGACSADSFGLPNDPYFYKGPDSEIAGNEFDDEFIWISPGVLYAKMLAAGKL